MSGETPLDEATIISRYLAPLTRGDPGALGLRDDCAVLTPADGEDLVVTTDSMVEGVHFFAGDVPSFKALAVNVSDLVAKGALPRAYLLNLSLPEAPTPQFMERVRDGLSQAQALFGCHLVGGDTDRTTGPFAMTITAIGAVARGRAVRRTTARVGDAIYVTGTIGDALLGLRLRKTPALYMDAGLDARAKDFLLERFMRPQPLLAVAGLVRNHATAALDVSDGLALDLQRLASASGLAAVARADLVPVSPATATMLGKRHVALADLLGGGEDYEVLATIAAGGAAAFEQAAGAAGIRVTRIGEMRSGAGVSWRDGDGTEVAIARGGWTHF